MASNTGTFTLAQQVSYDLAVGPRESLNVILTRTGSGAFSVALEERDGTVYTRVQTYAADTAGTVTNNNTDRRRYFRLVCLGVVGGDSIAYTLADTTGESLPGYPVRNAVGTVVFDVADDGIESPQVTATTLVGTLATAAQPNITSTGVLTSPVATRFNLGADAAAAAGASSITKAVTAIANNTATTVLTITVPNAAHAAVVRVTAMGVLGAGGAIGAGEAHASNSYDITVVRTAGVAAVAAISTAYGANAVAVAGAATVTAALTVAAVEGAVGASNSFPVQITIVRSGGSSANHTALVRAEVINQNATGISIA